MAMNMQDDVCFVGIQRDWIKAILDTKAILCVDSTLNVWKAFAC